MSLAPACSLEEVSLEEVLEDFKKFTLAYWVCVKTIARESRSIEEEEEILNEHLIKDVLPIAKTLSNFMSPHCEPREVKFSDLEKGVLGRRSLYTIHLNVRNHGDLIIPSVLVHEAAHALGAIFDEAVAMLLGWEIDARMVFAGHENHRTSLYICLRDMVFHVSYLKAKSVSRVEEWKDFVRKLYGDKITEKDLAQNIDRFERGEEEDMFWERLSYYSVFPYLSIKGVIKTNASYVLYMYELSDNLEPEKIEILTLVKIWNKLMRVVE